MKKVLIGLVVVVGILAAVIATRPAEFSVTRSGTMNAPVEVAFAQVADFQNWKGWSPWDALDPQQKTTFGGTPGAVGSTYHWSGNDEVGEGKMTIEELKPNELIRIKLEFIRPFPSTSDTIFAFKPENGGTSVTWTMSGNNDFVGKAFSMVMDMDKMLGADFEKGLAGIKKVSEDNAAKAAAAAQAAAAEAAAQAAAAPAEAPAAGDAAAPAADGTVPAAGAPAAGAAPAAGTTANPAAVQPAAATK